MAKKECKGIHNPCGGAVYGLGLVGAAVYFLQQATSPGEGVVGLIKALVWPGLLIYRLLEFLKF